MCIICIVDEKKRKERESNNSKRDVCVCVYFLWMLLNQRKKMNLIF
jgi:hypothetical protein